MADQATPAPAAAPAAAPEPAKTDAKTADKAAEPAKPDDKATPASVPAKDGKETPAVDPAAPPAEPAPVEPPNPIKNDLEALARGQQATRKEREANKRERAEIERNKGIIERAQRLDGLAKTDPLAYLKESGVDIDTVLQLYVQGAAESQPAEPAKPGDPAVAKLQETVEQLQAKLTKEAEDAKKAVEDAEWNKFAGGIKQNIAQAGDRFEIINSDYGTDEDLPGQVVEVIEGHYRDTQQVLSWETAAALVEAKAEERLRKGSRLKKFAPAQAPTEKQTGSQQNGKPSTITNHLAAPAGVKPADRPKLSRQESIDQAIARHRARGTQASA